MVAVKFLKGSDRNKKKKDYYTVSRLTNSTSYYWKEAGDIQRYMTIFSLLQIGIRLTIRGAVY